MQLRGVWLEFEFCDLIRELGWRRESIDDGSQIQPRATDEERDMRTSRYASQGRVEGSAEFHDRHVVRRLAQIDEVVRDQLLLFEGRLGPCQCPCPDRPAWSRWTESRCRG